MYIRQITFSIGNTMPLSPISGDPADEYANVKPHTSVQVAFGETECDPETKPGKLLLNKAFKLARESAFEAMVDFRKDFKAIYKDA